MEFRRIEVVKVVREAKRLDSSMSRRLFEKLVVESLFFTIRIAGACPYKQCLALSTTETELTYRGMDPKVRGTVKFDDIEYVEVECNMELLHHSDADNGRWENIQ